MLAARDVGNKKNSQFRMKGIFRSLSRRDIHVSLKTFTFHFLRHVPILLDATCGLGHPKPTDHRESGYLGPEGD